jgi:heptosyltransferase-3
LRSGRRFLLVQHRRIGDVLMCTPALRALREAHPEARIDFLTEPASVPVLERNPHLSNLLVSRGGFASQTRLLREIRRARYDAVVDFYGSPRSAWTVAFSGAPRRIGFPYRARRVAYTEAVGTPPRVYSALSRMHLVKRLGAWSDDLSLDFPISDNDRAFARRLWEREGLEDERVVAMFPSSRRADKVWPAERFSAVADALARGYDFRALLLWGLRIEARGRCGGRADCSRLRPGRPALLDAAGRSAPQGGLRRVR